MKYGWYNPEITISRGSIIGFSDVHGKAHFYRAIIEGIGFALREGIEKLEKKSGVKMEKIALSGGDSQSDVICQITANLINREVYKAQMAFQTPPEPKNPVDRRVKVLFEEMTKIDQDMI